MNDETPQRGRGVQSVEVGIDVLRALSNAGGTAGLTDLAQAVGMPPAKAHRYLASLVDSGMVSHRQSGAYELGPLAALIGLAALTRDDPVARLSETLSDLALRTGQAATLSVWGSLGPTVIRWERGATPLVTSLGLGSVLPLTRSATGHVFLTFLPRHVLSSTLQREEVAPEEIENVRASVTTSGVGRASQDFIPGLYALAAPVRDAQGSLAAVVTLVGTNADLIADDAPARAALLDFCNA